VLDKKIKFLFIGLIVFSAVIGVNHFEIRFDRLRSLFGSHVYEVTKASKNLPVSTKSDDTIEIAQVVELRRMLQDGQPDRLNLVLEKYQKLFEENPCNEYKVYDAYHAFGITVPSYEGLLERWITASPDKYQPYLAIAQYYYAKGWENRGPKWAKDTPEEHFEGMRLYFSEAEENIKAALKINPNLIVGYHLLINIYNAKGDNASENGIIQKASNLFPASFIILTDILWAKEPQWGGSYATMEAIAKGAEKDCDINPKLAALYGFIYSYQAKNFKRNKRYEEAVDLLTKAISFGDHWEFYNERANVYHFCLKEYDRALEDINRSIELRPTIDECYRMRSRIYFAKGDYDDSLKDLHIAEILSPGDSDTEEWKKWASEYLLNKGHNLFKRDPPGAIEEYSLSVEFDDRNFEPYYWRGVAFYRLEKFTLALSDLDLAIGINPHHFESYRMIDYILTRDQQWDKIISYWDRFLELEPYHADAYLERACTHYHNKDLNNALIDLEKACELGNQEACKRYEGLRGMQ
jgi:tetratricopeptide (TPR) repeat protein